MTQNMRIVFYKVFGFLIVIFHCFEKGSVLISDIINKQTKKKKKMKREREIFSFFRIIENISTLKIFTCMIKKIINIIYYTKVDITSI